MSWSNCKRCNHRFYFVSHDWGRFCPVCRLDNSSIIQRFLNWIVSIFI